MKRLSLMKKFMQNYVGKGIRLIIKENNETLKVHTIEVMQKTDNTCPVKNIPVGDYFIHLLATNPQGNEASIVCDWTDDLLKDLMTNYKDAKDAKASQIVMSKDIFSEDPERWLLSWSAPTEHNSEDPIGYIL